MKRYIYITALFALVSCSNDEVIDSTTSDPNEIKLAVTANNATRVSEEHDFNLSNSKFDLWTYWKNDNTLTAYFKSKVECDIVGIATFADGKHYYWPNKGSLLFLALHDKKHNDDEDSGTSTNVEPTLSTAKDNATLTYDVEINSDSSQQDDVLYAVADNYTSSTSSGTVNLNFRHALAQVSFALKNTSQTLAVIVDGIVLHNVFESGTMTVSSDIGTTTHYQYSDDYPTSKCSWANVTGTQDITYTEVTTDGSDDTDDTDSDDLDDSDGLSLWIPGFFDYSGEWCRISMPALIHSDGDTSGKNYTLDERATNLALFSDKSKMMVIPQTSAGGAISSDRPYIELKCRVFNIVYRDEFNTVVKDVLSDMMNTNYKKVSKYIFNLLTTGTTGVTTTTGNDSTDSSTTDTGTTGSSTTTENHKPYGSLLYGTSTTESKSIYIALPTGTEWKQGYRYVYTFSFGGDTNSGVDGDGNTVFVPMTVSVGVDAWPDADQEDVNV